MIADARQRVGPYQLLEPIGQGTMGRVFRAEDARSGETLAVKALLEDAGPEQLYDLKREFRLVRELSSPYLVPLYDLFVDGDAAYLVMPLLEGQTLDRWAAEPAHRRDPDKLYRVLAGLLTGVADLHGAGLIHQDIKPSNVMVEPGERVYLLDYGLAAQRQGPRRLTEEPSDGVSGTLAYLPPEALYGGEPNPCRDAFACGVLLFETLTGDLPPRYEHSWEIVTDRLAPQLDACDLPLPQPLRDALCGLLANDPELRATVGDALAALPSPDHAPAIRLDVWTARPTLIGRDAETATLRQALDEPGARVAVIGPSGIGKSSLCQEVLAEARAGHPERLVLAGRCHPGEHVPHRTLDEAIDRLSRWLARCPPSTLERLRVPDLRVAQEAFPVLRALTLGGEPLPLPASPEERRARLAPALADLLVATHALWPLTLWIDDVQWAEDDERPLLVELADHLPDDGPTLLLSGHRLIGAYRDLVAEPLTLAPLDAEACRALARERRRPTPSDDATRSDGAAPTDELDPLLEAADGNPGLICHLIDHASLLDADAPPDLARVVERRLASFRPSVRRVARAAALVSQPVPPGSFTEIDQDDLRRALHELESLGLVRRVPLRDEAGIEIAHGRLREAIVEGIAEGEAIDLHRRLATAIERLDVPRLVPHELVADCWQGAAKPARAIPHLDEAGRRAVQALAFDHAASCYERALSLSPHASVERLANLAEALALAGRGRAAAEHHRRAAALTPQAPERRRHLGLAATELIVAGFVDEGLDQAREVLADLGVTLPRERLAVMAQLAAQQLAARVTGWRFTPTPPREPPAEIADLTFALSSRLAAVDPALARCVHGIHRRHALRSGDRRRVARAMALEAGFEGVTGRDDGRLVPRALTLLDGEPAPHVQALAAINEAGAAWATGRWRACLRAAERAARIVEEELVGARWELSFARSVQQDALRWMGRYRELAPLTARYLDDATRREDRFARVTFRTRFASLCALVDDRLGDAWQACAADESWGASGVHLQHLAEIHARADALLYAGRPAEALALVERGLRRVRLSPLMMVAAPRAKLFAQLAGARLAVAATRRGEARSRLIRRARTALRWVRGPGWGYTDLLADILAATADLLEHAPLGDVAPPDAPHLQRLASRADHLDMGQIAEALRLAAARDEPSRATWEARLRDRGVAEPKRWAAVLLPGLVPGPPPTTMETR